MAVLMWILAGWLLISGPVALLIGKAIALGETFPEMSVEQQETDTRP